MASALDSGSTGPGSSPGQGTAWCSWARHFTFSSGPLNSGVQMGTDELMLRRGDPVME